MRILFCGDVVGRAGRDAINAHLPELKARLKPDVTIVNGENAAHGFGMTGKICEEIFAAGADVITSGNHTWDQREIMGYIGGEPRLIRPLNFPAGTPGAGSYIASDARGRKVLVVNAMCRLFMDPLDDPFAMVEALLARHPLGRSVQAIFIDLHGEATSEKMAFGHAFDGKVSAVVGTHTHVPTADCMVLPGGTAYQTDAGMTGDYDSVIGMDKAVPVERFRRKLPGDRLSPAEGEATLCGCLVDLDDASGLASGIQPVRVGGKLAPTIPGD